MYGFPAPNADGTQDLAALLYAPNTIDTILPASKLSLHKQGTPQPSAILMNAQRKTGGNANASGNRVQVQLDTEYPFGEALEFTVTAESAFKFRLRIPQWAADTATITMGHANPTPATPSADGFHTVSLAAGKSSLTLTLPMEVRIEEEQAGGVSVHAGALLLDRKSVV